MHYLGYTNNLDIGVNVEGGRLKISFDIEKNGYKNVFLTGPASYVFKGEIIW